jgi:phage terminase large subunit-like protein
MTEVLQQNTLERWVREPISFITEVLRNPETNRPFELMPAQREFFKHAFQIDDDGRLRYPEQLLGTPKKFGKTTTAAMHLLTTSLVFGGRFAEAYCVANDLEQAQGRVFQAVRRIVEASPYLRREAEVLQNRITFPETGATIQAIGSDYAGAAGANPTISSFDELWGYTSERSRRLWDEMVASPARKISARLVTTYAGFEGESVLLEELYKRGLQQPTVGTDLYAGDGLLCYWTHDCQAPWQNERWLIDMRRQLRPSQYARMIENRFTSTEAAFITAEMWDGITTLNGTPHYNPMVPIWIGIDASTKRDSTAIVAVTHSKKTGVVTLTRHYIFQPSPSEPLDFEATVERTIRELRQHFSIRKIFYDPFQMAATAQRLTRENLPIEEFPQTSPNLAAMSQLLFELIRSRQLAVYPDQAMRLAATRCVAVESSRGLRIDKAKASHKIDVIVALGMACFAAMQGSGQYTYTLAPFQPGFTDLDAVPEPDRIPSAANARLVDMYQALNFGASSQPATVQTPAPPRTEPIWPW